MKHHVGNEDTKQITDMNAILSLYLQVFDTIAMHGTINTWMHLAGDTPNYIQLIG